MQTTQWTVGDMIEWAAGDFRQLLVISAHGARGVLFDAKGGAESFIPAEADGDDGDWIILTDDENGVASYEAALAVVAPPSNHDALARAYQTLLENEGIPDGCALENLACDDLTPRQRAILSAFVILWDAADSEAGQ